VQPTKSEVGKELCAQIVQVCAQALLERGVFTIALSGGSLPSLLSDLPQAFAKAEIDPQFCKWHVMLADERCVQVSHEDSNLGALQKHLLSKIEIPPTQVYGIDKSKFSESTEAVAQAYEDANGCHCAFGHANFGRIGTWFHGRRFHSFLSRRRGP
jgi:6-phosphogluconolactonase